VPSGVYFARLRRGGKLIRQSLKTDKLSPMSISSAARFICASPRTASRDTFQ
jgi:hypothetical protein